MIAAFLCIAIGVYPAMLYDLLPNQAFDSHYEATYNAYSVTHVITQLQLLLFAAFAFGLLMRWKAYPPEVPSVNLDFDWVYRKALPFVVLGFGDLSQQCGVLGLRLLRHQARKYQVLLTTHFLVPKVHLAKMLNLPCLHCGRRYCL